MFKRFAALFLILALVFVMPVYAEDGPDEEETIEDILLNDLIDEDFISVEDYAVTENLPNEWWNILLLGTDNRYQEATHGRTDSMIILSVNPATGRAKMTSIMRDTWVPISGHGHTKINAASVYGGPELTMRTINECFGMNISDYVLINITGLAEVIDRLGGLDLEITEKERKALNKGLFDLSPLSGMEKLGESGFVHVNGNQAVAYSRIRKIDTDYRRTERQRYVLTEIARKLKENNAITIVSVITNLLPYVETNLDMTELMTLAYVGLNMDMDEVEQYRIPVDGTYDDGMHGKVWSIICDFDKNRSLLYNFIYNN